MLDEGEPIALSHGTGAVSPQNGRILGTAVN